MRRAGIVIASVIAVGLVTYAALRPSGGWVPKAVTKDTTCEVKGVVGSDASCEIVVRNTGFATLTLGRASAPNGVAVEGARTSIGWLRRQTIRVVVNTDALAGKGTFPLKIPTNDPKRKELDLEVKFDIRAYL